MIIISFSKKKTYYSSPVIEVLYKMSNPRELPDIRYSMLFLRNEIRDIWVIYSAENITHITTTLF